MFKSVKEIQDFIVWAKSEKLKIVKLGDLEVEISELNYIEEIAQPSTQEQREDVQSNNADEDEDLLYWSSRG